MSPSARRLLPRQRRLRQHIHDWQDCQLCPLGKTATHHVLYRGQVPCQVLFVGEAPGESEDILGEPFVGPAGDILNDLIEDTHKQTSIYFSYAITNVVCCLPYDTENDTLREPTQIEASACNPRLREFVSLCNPSLVVLLGKIADRDFGRRKEFFRYQTLSIKHPAYISRQPQETYLVVYKRELLRLVQKIESLLG